MADPSYIVDGVLTDGEAWVALASTTLTSDAASITFTSTDDGQVGDWSQYMDLVLISYLRGTAAGVIQYCFVRLNEDSTTAYPYQKFWGDGSSVTAEFDAGTSGTYGFWMYNLGAGAGANEFSAHIGHIFDINSGKYKSYLGMDAADSNGDGQMMLTAQSYLNQAPVTHLQIFANSGNIKDESRIDLFGVLPRMVA